MLCFLHMLLLRTIHFSSSSMMILSSAVFIPLYARPSQALWRYKCNPKFPSPLLVKKEIVHTVKVRVACGVGVMSRTPTIMLSERTNHPRTHTYPPRARAWWWPPSYQPTHS